MGKTEWFVPDMFWPVADNGEYVSHEAICILNTNDVDCHVDITLYFIDRDPVKCEHVVCPANRTVHLRNDVLKLADGSDFPRGCGYAAVVKCSVPVYAQYTRVDTTQEPLALMTTMCG